MDVASDASDAVPTAREPLSRPSSTTHLDTSHSTASDAIAHAKLPLQHAVEPDDVSTSTEETTRIETVIDTTTTITNGTDDVEDLLAIAAARQRTFQRIRDAVGENLSVRDDRKCDYGIEPVRRPTRTPRGSRRGSLIDSSVAVHSKSEQDESTRKEEIDEDAPTTTIGRGIAWRHALQAHVTATLRQLRLNRDELRVFISAQYSDEDEHGRELHNQETDDDAHDDDDDESDGDGADGDGKVGLKRRGGPLNLNDISPQRMQRIVNQYQNVHKIYARLHRIGMQLGEKLYHQVYSMMMKSVAHGVIPRSANIVRLESVFRLELRRHITIDKIRQEVLGRQTALRNKQRRQRLRRASQIKRRVVEQLEKAACVDGSDKSLVNGMASSTRVVDDLGTDETRSGGLVSKSAHYYKLLALERVLALARHASTSNHAGLQTSGSRRIILSEQLEDQIQEKLTAMVYSKTRDYFPFWKDPPENSFTREETMRQVRTVLAVLSTMAVFRTMSVDNLVEVTRATKWRSISQFEYVCKKDLEMSELYVIMDGRVVAITSETTTEVPTVGPAQRGSIPVDDRRSVDSMLEWKDHYGEHGLLTKTERWPFSLQAVTENVKILVLTRDAFESVLNRIFGGSTTVPSKRMSTVTYASTSSSTTPQRPVSSPAPASARLRSSSFNASVRTGSMYSGATNTAAIVAREHNVEVYRRFRDEQLVQEHRPNQTEQDPATTTESSKTEAVLAPRQHTDTSSLGVFQHYPSFPAQTSTTRDVGAGMFQLKCTQPIAFGMESIENSIADEWAPAFPDTLALVDYLSSHHSIIFDKRNVLIKENLRLVCTNLPYQDDPTPTANRDGGNQVLEAMIPAENVGGGSVVNPPLSPVLSDGEGGMTLGQFAEARRKVFGRGGSTVTGRSAQNSGSSPDLAALDRPPTAGKPGTGPFTSASFVIESSFNDGARLKTIDMNEVEESDEPHERPVLQKSTAMTSSGPEEDDDEEDDEDQSVNDATENEPVSEIPATATRARKNALESLIKSMSSTSPSKRKMSEHDAARRVLMQKHSQVIHLGSTSATPNGNALKQGKQGDTSQQQTTPLPLRVDLQRRMEAVLAALHMKAKAKLDLVLKYTHADHYDLFPDAVTLWEQALHYILKREKALETLREFEMVASDPRRHFRSLSTHRLTEQKQRDAFFCQLNYASDLCRDAVEEVEQRCGDIVYWHDRAYRDKMKRDYTELLYEVEQERLRIIYKGVRPAVQGDDGQHREQQSAPPNPGPTTSPRPGGGHVVGKPSRMMTHKYDLTTPRESIYQSVHEISEEDKRTEDEQKQQQRDQYPSLSVQVKLHRQAELNASAAAKTALPPSSNRTPAPTTPRTPRQNKSVIMEVRPPEHTVNDTRDRNGLKNALEQILRRTSST